MAILVFCHTDGLGTGIQGATIPVPIGAQSGVAPYLLEGDPINTPIGAQSGVAPYLLEGDPIGTPIGAQNGVVTYMAPVTNAAPIGAQNSFDS